MEYLLLVEKEEESKQEPKEKTNDDSEHTNKKANDKRTNNGYTPLHLASYGGHLEVEKRQYKKLVFNFLKLGSANSAPKFRRECFIE